VRALGVVEAEVVTETDSGFSVQKVAAIARGVEARFDPSSILSKTITQRTTEIARQLGLAEEEIRR